MREAITLSALFIFYITVYKLTQAAQRRERTKAKAKRAHARRVHRIEFAKLKDTCRRYSESEPRMLLEAPKGKHRNTQFHDPALAELCGGVALTKAR